MASSILRTSFLPLFHSQETHSFPSSTNLTTLELKVSLSLSLSLSQSTYIITLKKRAVLKES